jgi:hypothetical protein
MTTPPAWLDALLERIAGATEALAPMESLGFHYHVDEDDTLWEVLVYPTPVKVVGGPESGTLLFPGFSLDLQALVAAFDTVVAVYWLSQGQGPVDPEGPAVTVEGTCQGHTVFLRVLAYAPDDEPPGMALGAPPSDVDLH